MLQKNVVTKIQIKECGTIAKLNCSIIEVFKRISVMTGEYQKHLNRAQSEMQWVPIDLISESDKGQR